MKEDYNNMVQSCPPAPECITQSLYHLRIFACNHVVAKSCFWYFVSQLKKRRKSSGELTHPLFLLKKMYLFIWRERGRA
uniref:Uncharacterized protein n=1 Tax=Suricata suricatta TaxID=37032 RepID=A0A673U699_SURSU